MADYSNLAKRTSRRPMSATNARRAIERIRAELQVLQDQALLRADRQPVATFAALDKEQLRDAYSSIVSGLGRIKQQWDAGI